MSKTSHSKSFVALVNDALTRVDEISAGEIAGRLNSGADLELIDVREKDEFEAGHVKGAKHLSKGIIERDIEKVIPEKNREVVLYCGGGYRSVLAADNLKKMGYKDVKSLAGGWKEWVFDPAKPVSKPLE